MNEKEGISIITPTIRKACIPNIIANYKRQAFKDKELIIILNKDDIKKQDFPLKIRLDAQVKIISCPERMPLGSCLNEGISRAQYTYVAKLDDDDYYGSKYLTEVYSTLKNKDCDLVCKKSIYYYFKGSRTLLIYVPFVENTLVLKGAGATIAMPKALLETVSFSAINAGSDTDFFKKARQLGLKIYSSSHEHYLCIREANPARHTWQASEQKIRSSKKGYYYGQMTLEEACSWVEREESLL